MASEVITTGEGAAGLTGELSLLMRCMREPCLDAPPPPPGRRATTAATMALAPTTALDCPVAAAGCTCMERVSMGLVGHEELLVCSSGFSMAEAASRSTTLTEDLKLDLRRHLEVTVASLAKSSSSSCCLHHSILPCSSSFFSWQNYIFARCNF